nr:ATP-binding cassette domain-containing protein [Maridesulfovibrio bastinii]
MLEAKNLSFRYSKKHQRLFQNLDISIAPGERVGLPGPSGRGKSTLAKILAGYLKPDEGDITVDGKQIVHGSFNPVQILFQHPELAVNPRWKIKNILNEAGTPSADLLDSLKISSSWAERYPNELSGGELQRVCLARALDGRTGYLLCDEMTSMLDPLTQASIWKTVLETAAERNLGLLIISHDTALLDRLCHRKVEAFI